MAGVLTTNVLPLQHSKELDKIFKNTLKESPSEFDKIFKVQQAEKGNRVSRADLSGLGLPSGISEGESVRFDLPAEGNFKQRSYSEFGLGYIITKRKIDDEQFGEMKKLPADLARSMKLLMDIEAMKVFNEGGEDDTATGNGDHAKSKDNVRIWTRHAILNPRIAFTDPGDAANTTAGEITNVAPVAADLSETSFFQMLKYFDRMVDENGYPVVLTPSKLIISMEDKYVAHRLHTQMYGSSVELAGLGGAYSSASGVLGVAADASYQTDVANNIANPANGFVTGWQIIPSRFLSGDGRWFMASDQCDAGFYWKEQPKQTSEQEFDTDNIKYKSKMRFGVWIDEYAHIWGNVNGTAPA